MNNPFALASVAQLVSQTRDYFFHHVLSWNMVAQIVVIGCALLLAHKAS
jgi:hypothetical protein